MRVAPDSIVHHLLEPADGMDVLAMAAVHTMPDCYSYPSEVY